MDPPHVADVLQKRVSTLQDCEDSFDSLSGRAIQRWVNHQFDEMKVNSFFGVERQSITLFSKLDLCFHTVRTFFQKERIFVDRAHNGKKASFQEQGLRKVKPHHHRHRE